MLRNSFHLSIVLLLALSVFTKESFAHFSISKDRYKDRIAILSAFDKELELLRDNTKVDRIEIINGTTFILGELEGHDVVLLLTGVSIANAVMKTQLLLDNFEVERVIFSGVAGAVGPSPDDDIDVDILDVVIPNQWALYQEMYFAKAEEKVDDTFSFPIAEGRGSKLADIHRDENGNVIDNLNSYLFVYTRKIDVVSMNYPDFINYNTGDSGVGERVFWMPVDEEMFKVASTVTPSLLCVINTNTGEAGFTNCQKPTKVVPGGNGLSGPTFVDNKDYNLYLRRVFGAKVLDMETAGVAFVCRSNNVPYLAFRSLSDRAGGDKKGNPYRGFSPAAAKNSAEAVLEFLTAWEKKNVRN